MLASQIKIILGLIIAGVGLSGCAMLSSGYYNSDGEFVPKKANYKFKNKAGFSIPKNLDTKNIYQKTASYLNGTQIYPVSPYATQTYQPEETKYERYIRFFPKGHFYSFSKKKPSKLNSKDLNPNQRYYTRGYYFSSGGQTLTTESFAAAEGQGMYLYFNYEILDGGKTLKMVYDKTVTIYQLREIPASWQNPL